jgi:hypothetical protein
MKVPRKYHLTQDELKKLQEEWKTTGIFPNPFKKHGIYFNLVQALINLGINEKHPFAKVKNEIKRIMSVGDGITSWQEFENKKPRNMTTSKDVNGRIIQNAIVLQRLSKFHPCGRKIQELGACIDIFQDTSGLPEFMLHTGFVTLEEVIPVNELKLNKRGRKKK